jgi:hypothetical protein
MSDERALSFATPRGLLVRTHTGGDAPVLRVRRRWPRVGTVGAVVAAGAISGVPLLLSIGLMVVPVALLRAGLFDAQRIEIDRDGIRARGRSIPFDDLERCELEARRVIAILRSGHRVHLFTGTRAQATWLVHTVEAAREARSAPMPLPRARVVSGG